MHTVRTTLNLPVALIKEAKKWFGVDTKTEAIVLALKEAVRNKKLLKYATELGGCGFCLDQASLKMLRKNRIS